MKLNVAASQRRKSGYSILLLRKEKRGRKEGQPDRMPDYSYRGRDANAIAAP